MKTKQTLVMLLAFLALCLFFCIITPFFFQSSNSKQSPTTTTTTAELIKIRENTTTHPFKTGFDNVYGSVTIVVAMFAFITALLTYVSQKKTEEHTMDTEKHAKETEAHTKNMPYKVQEGILLDMPRHQYRNLLCTLAMIKQYQESRVAHQKNPKSVLRYPSEANMLKLQTLPEQTLVKMDIEEEEAEKIYRIMQETSLFFRNTNNEILAASEHFRRENLDDKSFVSDADNLLFKPLYLCKGAQKLNNTFSKDINAYNKQEQSKISIMATILAEHILKGKEESIDVEKHKQLTNNEFPNHLFELPNFDGTNPIQRSFVILFGPDNVKEATVKDVESVKKEELFQELENYKASEEDKQKISSFIKSIKENKNTTYGDVLNSKTEYINFWNLFKIMCYLDSRAEEKNIGMINVA